MDSRAIRQEQFMGASVSTPIAWIGKSIVVGMVAGMAMAMFAMVVAALAGDGFWAPPRAIAASVFGTGHAGAGFVLGSVLAGVVIHMMMSGGFGIVYALFAGLVTRTLSVGAQLMLGMAWGLILWAVNTALITPRLAGGQLFTQAMPAWAWLVAHLMFGAALGLLYALWRRDRTALSGAAS